MERTASLDRVFHALSDPTRRRILETLARGERPVLALARQFAISQPAVTKHLHVLEKAGLITRRKEGRTRRCRAAPEALRRPLAWIERWREFWNDRLDGVEAALARAAAQEPGDPIAKDPARQSGAPAERAAETKAQRRRRPPRRRAPGKAP